MKYVPISISPNEASFHLLCATIPGVVTSCMENSTNACLLISEMSKKKR